MLSGECRLYREYWKRGMYKFWKDDRSFRLIRGFQDCVKRRATLSITNGTDVKDLREAAKIVDSVWDSCFADTRPFDDIYK
jgi:mitochondrial inner membrane protease ATP23